ncbi:unnamed protein product [Thlaspi arvense]|uniref:Uncharacterized protein n=1 Tax=Thlaspi arvense TaxID=13288 RepID=A0AAU9SPC2_THLAR|nr:unnamed protein product [Thlaspi arvense]
MKVLSAQLLARRMKKFRLRLPSLFCFLQEPDAVQEEGRLSEFLLSGRCLWLVLRRKSRIGVRNAYSLGITGLAGLEDDFSCSVDELKFDSSAKYNASKEHEELLLHFLMMSWGEFVLVIALVIVLGKH